MLWLLPGKEVFRWTDWVLSGFSESEEEKFVGCAVSELDKIIDNGEAVDVTPAKSPVENVPASVYKTDAEAGLLIVLNVSCVPVDDGTFEIKPSVD